MEFALNGITADPITNPVNFRKRREKLAKTAGVKWKYDGLRHTYGSMLFAQTGNKQLVIVRTARKWPRKTGENRWQNRCIKQREKLWEIFDASENLMCGR